MENSLGALSKIQFGKLDNFKKAEVQGLADELDTGLFFESSDIMSILADWHKCAKDAITKGRIEKVAGMVLGASALGSHAAKYEEKGKAQAKGSLAQFMEKASMLREQYGFRASVFDPREKTSKTVIGAIEEAVKKGRSVEETESICKQKNLGQSDTAFVLNFANVYWKAFENEPDLRESPKAMVQYFLDEPVSGIKEKGYGSYFISLMNDGKPAGFVTGAIFSLNSLFERFGMERLEKDVVATFVGYLALSREFQMKGGDVVVLSELENLVKSQGLQTDYFIVQIDKPGKLGEDIDALGKRIGRLENLPLNAKKKRTLEAQKDSLEYRERASRMLLRIWQGRYALGTVDGLKSMEIISEYSDTKSGMDAPEKQPPLELLIRPRNGSSQMPRNDLENIVKALYMYYGVYPDRKLKETGGNALQAYMDFSMEGVGNADLVGLGKVQLEIS